MKILFAINKPLSPTPLQYMVTVLKDMGHHIDIIQYPVTRKYRWIDRTYQKLERIYLKSVGYKQDLPFEPYLREKKSIDFILEINKDVEYNLVVNFCDSVPDDIEKIKCKHKWHVTNYNNANKHGIDSAGYIIRNKGVIPLYIWQTPENKLIYFSETLGVAPSILKNDFDLLCKAVNVIIRSIAKHDLRMIQNSSKATQQKYKELNFGVLSIGLHILRFLYRWVKNNFLIEQGNLLIAENPKKLPTNLKLFKKIKPPKDRRWADPFVIESDSMNYLFVEERMFDKNKGIIRCLKFKDIDKIDIDAVTLEMPYHLSFPFIFSYQEKFFMIPETSKNNSIEMFECVSFPERWQKRKTLIKDIIAVDSFICFRSGKWWLFTNVASGPGCDNNDELHIYFANDPLNCDWIPHPLNPVIEGSGSSRNAGAIFEHGDKLYRPSQICSHRYGLGVNINEVLRLNEYQYEERCINRIIPSRRDNTLCVHTLNLGTKYIVMDGVSLIRKL